MNPSSKRKVLGACFAIAVVAVLVLLKMGASSAPGGREAPVSHPDLFDGEPRCSSAREVVTQADGMARRARLSAERYPYDPRDGIRAVANFLEAEHCYSLAGKPTRARRMDAVATELIARINADYAAARLLLDHSLKSERWSLARNEVERLLDLTAHLEPHAYVEWLRDISGKVAALADDSP